MMQKTYHVKTRKPHTCELCKQPIIVGSDAQWRKGLSLGERNYFHFPKCPEPPAEEECSTCHDSGLIIIDSTIEVKCPDCHGRCNKKQPPAEECEHDWRSVTNLQNGDPLDSWYCEKCEACEEGAEPPTPAVEVSGILDDAETKCLEAVSHAAACSYVGREIEACDMIREVFTSLRKEIERGTITIRREDD